MNFIKIIASMFFLIIVTIKPQTKITLDEAIKIALQKNTSLNQAKNNIISQESALKSAYGNLFPSLSVQGSWNWEKTQQAGSTRFFNGIPFIIPPTTSETKSFFAGLSSDVILFDGLANIENIDLSKNNLNSIKLFVEYLKQQIALNTIVKYYMVLTQKELLKVREENLKKQRITYQLIEERNRLGAATMADLYQQQVELGNAELQLINQSLEVEKAQNDLVIFLGLDISGNYEFDDESIERISFDQIKNLEENFDDIQSRISEAYNNRLDYKSKLLELKSSLNSVNIARAGHLPTVVGSVGFSTFSNKLNDLFDSKSYSVGLRINFPIFSNFNVSNRIQLAEIQSLNKQLEINELERKIRQEITQTYKAFLSAKKSLSVSEKNVKAAEERLRIEQEKYNIGSGRLLDLQIANAAFVVAQTDFVNSQFNYLIISEQIKFYLGILDISKFDLKGE
ncbi:MAG: TolC family protein [Ignavibacterium sp.]|nr:TolC family protein [Ignavibacterium sp.]MCX7611532.1 TolC family protein [Ignavibacterium sp.]MDW8375752.1 TolC family protein [Ignavibacteriales bacterium]